MSTNGNINEFIGKYIFLFVFLSNLAITKIMNRGVLLQELLICIFILINFASNKINYKTTITIVLLIILPILVNLSNEYNAEFVKSYVLFIIYIVFVIFQKNVNNKHICLTYYLKGINILVIFGVVQTTIRILRLDLLSEIVNNPFGNYALSKNLYESYFNVFPRANSLFYEPSIFGLICLSGIAVALYLKEVKSNYYKNHFLIYSVIGTIISFSAIAIIGLGVIILLRAIYNKNNIFFKYITFIIGIIISLYLFFIMSHRISEIFTPNTSGYYRVVSPVKLIKDMFLINNNWFGIGMGHLEDYIVTNSPIYMMKEGLHGISLGTTIDNVFYMLILTFGISILPVLIYFIIYSFRRLNKMNCYILIALLFMSIGTGGYNFIYFNIVLAVFVLIFQDEVGDINEETKCYHGNIQQ